MKKSTKAVLLSAFVFPGVGHIYLKQYVAGILLAGTSLVAIYYLVSKAVEMALEISEKIQSGEVNLDVEAITALLSQQSSSADAQLLNIATSVLVICWLVGIVDSYRVGRVLEKDDDVPDSRQI